MNNNLNAAREAAEPVLPSATLAKEIHHTLWGEICSLKRLPGEKLSEAKLAREYHCSRIPVREAVKQLAAEGMTMAVVTHEMGFAREVGTRLFFMDEGRILEQGHPKEVFDDPKEDRTREFLSKVL